MKCRYCGKTTKNNYCRGHHPRSRNGFKKGHAVPKSWRKIMSEKKIGFIPHHKGKTKESYEPLMKISKALTGRKQSEEHRRKNIKSHIGQKNPRKEITYEEYYGKEKALKIKEKNRLGHVGIKHSEESKRKLSEKTKGKNAYWYGKKRLNIRGNNSSNKRPEVKEKLRKAAINYKKENNLIFLNIGKHETQLLDEFELSNRIKIIRQYEICGYVVDGYCEELNIAIEVDEKYHNSEKRKIKDIKRQKEIKRELDCQFIRIKDY